MNHQESVLSSTSPAAQNYERLRVDSLATPTVRSQHAKRRQIWNSNHVPNYGQIPVSLGNIVPDPEGTLEQMDVLSPRDFWRFYYVEDGPDDPAVRRMAQKWGEMWLSYLVSDPVVLSGAVPLVLQKKAQLTRCNEDKSIHLAEMKALKLLRERLEAFDVASVGGLIMSVCGRTQIAIQQGDLDSASIHLQAVKKLMNVHTLTATEWLCSAWSDLRVVSSTGAEPTLPRFIPEVWRDMPAISMDSTAASKHLALRNARAFQTCAGGQFRSVYHIFQRLHELEAALKDTSSQDSASMQQIYEVTYDCCLLHASSREGTASTAARNLLELVAICLKLCAWEKASHCIPRGGEIERSLLQRALIIVQGRQNSASMGILPASGVPSNAMFWMIFALTATAFAFAPAEMEIWMALLKRVTRLSTPSTFKRALNDWPTAPWWFTRAANRICTLMKPVKGNWEVLNTDQNAWFIAQGGMRLKLLVIEG